ncbi:MAG: cytochrome c, partial [Pseudomonadota bacterium]|nr:cytochrome c [Pseudomonadota bacterium]
MVAAAADDPITRGEYLLRAGACESCHTDIEHGGAFLAGGRGLKTEFGTFHAPNITPDPDTGLGRWSLEDFRRAMRDGTRPDGSPYYPVFPYRWYTGMTDQDIADLWAYLQAVPAVENVAPPHDLPFPFTIRWLVAGWKLINFSRGETVSDPAQPAQWNRGAYLVNHVSHCGACHTPTILGNFIASRFLGGSAQIPGILPAPNITPDLATGIGAWSRADVVRALKRAMFPDGSPIVGSMAEYVHFGSAFMTDADLEAIAAYLATVEPVVNEVRDDADKATARPHGSSPGVKSLMISGG